MTHDEWPGAQEDFPTFDEASDVNLAEFHIHQHDEEQTASGALPPWEAGSEPFAPVADDVGLGGHDSPDVPGPYASSLDAPSPHESLLIGHPDADMRFWHEQEAPNSCAVAAQEDVLESVTGLSFDESRLAVEAEADGWYDPARGTPLAHVGDLLEEHGVPTVREDGGTVEELMTLAAQDVPVIVSVDSAELWGARAGDAALADAPVIVGGGAMHVVVVTGFDLTDPLHPCVVVNDSGVPDGAGMRVGLDRFEEAWAASGHVMVHPGESGASAGQELADMPGSGLVALVGAEPVEPVMVGTALSVDGETESGNPVAYSTTTNEYYDTKTWETVEPK
ncbi:MAG TPA: C39 family peptidase [Streptomyces sp.]